MRIDGQAYNEDRQAGIYKQMTEKQEYAFEGLSMYVNVCAFMCVYG